MQNHAERLLSTVQHLRHYLSNHPNARGDLAEVERWLPPELFPPERDLIVQALNVLINAGELFMTDRDRPEYSARSPLKRAASD